MDARTPAGGTVGLITVRDGSADDADGGRHADERRGLSLAEVVAVHLEMNRPVRDDPELLEVLEDDRRPAADALAAEHPAGGPQRPDGAQLAHRDQVEAAVE